MYEQLLGSLRNKQIFGVQPPTPNLLQHVINLVEKSSSEKLQWEPPRSQSPSIAISDSWDRCPSLAPVGFGDEDAQTVVLRDCVGGKAHPGQLHELPGKRSQSIWPVKERVLFLKEVKICCLREACPMCFEGT